MNEHSYIMDSPLEGERIERKTRPCLTREQLRLVGVAPGMRVLDLGCASGTTTRIIADMVGAHGQAVGVDVSAQRIDEARSRDLESESIEYRVGEASALPAGGSEFDLAWSRFLFEYLADTRGAIREMVRVVREGGLVAISDLDGNCVWHDPVNPELRSFLDRAAATLGNRFDPYVGRTLYGLAVNCGLTDVRVDIRPYHIIAGAASEEDLSLWTMKLETVAATLCAAGWAHKEAERFRALFLDHLADPSTLTYSVLMTVWGVRAKALRA